MAAKTGLELVWSGSSAKAYSAFFGSWKKITEAYALVYGTGDKTYNTGRTSIAVKQLATAGYVTSCKHESTNWRLYTSTLEPVFQDARTKKVEFSDSEKEFLENFLGCASKKPVGALLSCLVSFDKTFFTPPLSQAKDALHGLASISIPFLFHNLLEGRRLQSYLTSLKAALGEVPASQAQLASPFSDAATKLSVQVRAATSKNDPLDSTLLFKLAKYLYPPQALKEVNDLAKEAL